MAPSSRRTTAPITPDLLPNRRSTVCTVTAASAATSSSRIWSYGATDRVTAELADITVPCLYVASDDRADWSPEAAENAARLTPNATAVTVAQARTLIPLEQPAEPHDW